MRGPSRTLGGGRGAVASFFALCRLRTASRSAKAVDAGACFRLALEEDPDLHRGRRVLVLSCLVFVPGLQLL